MKKSMMKVAIACVAALMVTVPAETVAADSNIVIGWQKKVPEGKAVKHGDTFSGSEDCVYTITLSNNAFKDATKLDVEYDVFVERQKMAEKAGSEHIEHVKGKATVENITAMKKVTVDTTKFTLHRSTLGPGTYFTNGGNRSAKDSVKGVWIRVMQEGKLVAEYINPSTLKTK